MKDLLHDVQVGISLFYQVQLADELLIKSKHRLLRWIEKSYFIPYMLVIWVTLWSICWSCANKGTQQSQRCFQRHHYDCLPNNLWDIFTFPHSNTDQKKKRSSHQRGSWIKWSIGLPQAWSQYPRQTVFLGTESHIVSKLKCPWRLFFKEILSPLCIQMMTPIKPGLKCISF